MKKPVKTIQIGEDVITAAKIMTEHKIGSLVVVDGLTPVGMVTERDIVHKLVSEGKSPRVKIQTIMSTNLRKIEQDRTTDDAAKLMSAHRVRRILVTDKKGEIVGVVASEDIMRHKSE